MLVVSTSCSSSITTTPGQPTFHLTVAGSPYSGQAYINWPFPGVPLQPVITGNFKSGSQTAMVFFTFTTVPPPMGMLMLGDVGTTDVTASYSGPSGMTISCNADPARQGTLTLTVFSKQQVAGTFSFITEGSNCPGPVDVTDGSFDFQPAYWYPYGDPASFADGGGG